MGAKRGVPNYHNQKSPGEASYNMLFGQYRYNAKIKKLIFELDKKSFKEIISQDCYYCGTKPKKYNAYASNSRGVSHVGFANAWVYVNGVDRIDSTLGYVKGNCIPCCTVCNKMKLTYSVKFFVHHIFKIARHMFLNRKFEVKSFF